MKLVVDIPDELARRLNAAGTDVPRRVLEALALEGYRGGHFTKAELRRLLGFETSDALAEFLKARAGWLYAR